MKAVKAEFNGENSLANVIRLFRISKDMTISDLSEKTGTSRSYLCDVESGKKKPSSETVKKIAKAMDVPYSTIYFFDEEQAKYAYPYRKLLSAILKKIDQLETKKQALLSDLEKEDLEQDDSE